MEKNNGYDMYDFLDESVTKFDSMYKILSNYIPELHGDFSTANLINSMPKLINGMGKQKVAVDKFYKSIFDELASTLLDSAYNHNIDRYDRSKKLSVNEKSNLLEKFRQTGNPKLKSLDEYINYAKENISTLETDDLRKLIVQNAIQVGSKELIDDLRYKTISTFYVPIVMNQLNNKYTVEDRISGNCPEWNIMQFIRETLSNENRFIEYNQYVEEHNKKIQEFIRQSAINTVCENKRTKEVMKTIKDSMSDEQKQRLSEYGLIDTIFPVREKMDEPKKGQFSWNIEPYKEPKILMDAMTNYSKDGIENQRVMAVSYGKFFFEKDVVKNDIVPPELIGVTRVGKDGVRTYFVIATLDKIDFRGNPLTKENETEFSIKVDGKNALFVDRDNGQNYYTFMQNQKIPENMKGFFAETFFSDMYLSEVEKQNYGYAGSARNTNRGPVIEVNEITDYILDAVRYANLFPGMVGTRQYASLKEYIDYSDFQINHLRTVKKISDNDLSINRRNTTLGNR